MRASRWPAIPTATFRTSQASTDGIAATLRQGWFYTGQHSVYRARAARHRSRRHSAASGSTVCLQNHDQIGNRALGERLHHQIERDRSIGPLSAVLLLRAGRRRCCSWARNGRRPRRSCYFTDHGPKLGRLVTEGRRKRVRALRSVCRRAIERRFPTRRAPRRSNGAGSQWQERSEPPHAGTLALYRALLRLRQRDRLSLTGVFQVTAPDSGSLAYERLAESGQRLLVVARLRGGGTVDLAGWQPLRPDSRWSVLLTTEDEAFCEPADRGRFVPRLARADGDVTMTFARPGAAILGSA